MTQRTHSRRGFWIGLTAAAVALALMVGFAGWTLDPASLKPRLVEAVQRATGRTLTVSGKLGIRLSLVPTVSMEDVTLSNPPGFSRPEMVKVARVELGLALLPLLRHRFEVDHVALVRPDILLETDQAGRANWVFARTAPQAQAEAPSADAGPAPPAGVAPVTAPSGGAAKSRFTVSFKGANAVDARIGLIDARSGHRFEVAAPLLSVVAPRGGPVQLTGAVAFEGQTVGLTARVEPTELPDGSPGTAPWPVSLKLESGGATVTADGQIAHPLQGRGYSFAIDANLPDPSVFAPLFPRFPLASLKSLTAHTEVSDSGGPVPTISALRVNLGSVDLDKAAHGARLEDVSLTARDGAPIKVAARVSLAGSDSGISGTIGDLPWLLKGASDPVGVDLEWNAASARASVKGTIQTPARFAGLALDVAVNVPDPSLVLNDAPPALKSVAFQARLTDAPGRPVPFQLTSSAGDLTGALSVSRSPRLSVEGQVSSQRLDLDVFRPPAAMPATGARRAAEPSADAPAVPELSPTAAVPLVRDHTAPMIPDTKLPFDLIRAVDANVKFSFARVLLNGADIRRIDGAVAVKDGQLRLDPFTIAGPDQRLSAVLVADGTKSPPAVHLSLDAPGLALRPLLVALGLPQAASGTVAVQADLTGAGDSPRAIAASLGGWAGVAVEGGQLDAQMVNSWLGPLQPLHIGGAGVTDLRCFALRADAKSGTVTIKPVALNTAALIVEGGGDVDLGRETLALRLRPRTKIGGTGIALPVRVSGPMRSPSAKIDISPGGPGGGFAGLLLGGKDIMGAAGGGDPCPAALVRAREGATPSGTAEDAPHLLPPVPGGKR